MKHSLILLLFFGISINMYGQVFGNRILLEDSLLFINNITTGDLNNDGLIDIITTQGNPYRQIGYYLNQGSGIFGNKQILDTSISLAGIVDVIDMNSDGWQDIISVQGDPIGVDSLFIFYNNINNNFTKSLIDTTSDTWKKIIKVKSVDVDNDNDLDIIAISDVYLYVYYNDGNGNFTKTTVPAGISMEYYTFDIEDIDNDGFIDIIIGGTMPVVYKNSNGSFAYDDLRTNSFGFTGLILFLQIDDFNNDGDFDVLIKRESFSDVSWYENDGSGFFTFKQTIEANVANCNCMHAITKDLTLDGNIDILAIYSQTGKVVWYENTGNGTFGTSNIIYTGSSPYTTQVYSDDLNNDGKNDVIWADELSIHLNTDTTTVITDTQNYQAEWVKLYPVPASDGKLYVESLLNAQMHIYDISGNLVMKGVSIHKGINEISLSLKSQVYLLEIQNADYSFQQKLIVK